MNIDTIQIWMFIGFIVALIFSFYKVYIVFNKPAEGLDTKELHKKLSETILIFLEDIQDSSLSNKTLYELLIKKEELLDNKEYRNFNQNRFNQLIQQLFYKYEVDSTSELIKTIKKSKNNFS